MSTSVQTPCPLCGHEDGILRTTDIPGLRTSSGQGKCIPSTIPPDDRVRPSCSWLDSLNPPSRPAPIPGLLWHPRSLRELAVVFVPGLVLQLSLMALFRFLETRLPGTFDSRRWWRWLAIPALILLVVTYAKGFRDYRRERRKALVELEKWEHDYNRWFTLRCCTRCQVVFDPGTGQIVYPESTEDTPSVIR